MRMSSRSSHLDLDHSMLKIAKEQLILVADVEVGCVSDNNAILRMKESGLMVAGTESKACWKLPIAYTFGNLS